MLATSIVANSLSRGRMGRSSDIGISILGQTV